MALCLSTLWPWICVMVSESGNPCRTTAIELMGYNDEHVGLGKVIVECLSDFCLAYFVLLAIFTI